MALPKEFRKGILGYMADAVKDMYNDMSQAMKTDFSAMGRLMYSDLFGTLERGVASTSDEKFGQAEPEEIMAAALTSRELANWHERISMEQDEEWDALKRESLETYVLSGGSYQATDVPTAFVDPVIYEPSPVRAVDNINSIEIEIDVDNVVEDKGYTEKDFDDAIMDHELREMFTTAISDLVGDFENKDSLYHLKALSILGKVNSYDIDSLEDAFLELSDIKSEYEASKVSYRGVLERADALQELIESGLVGTGLQTKMLYGKKMESIYNGIDEAMIDEGGQKKLADLVSDLDVLEKNVYQKTASRISSLANKVETAYARAVATDAPKDVRKELFDGAKSLAELTANMKYNGLKDRDIDVYMAAIKGIEGLADETLTVDGRNSYIPPPIKVKETRAVSVQNPKLSYITQHGVME